MVKGIFICMRTRLFACVLAAASLLLSAQFASADVYSATTASEIPTAIATADLHPGEDTVVIGPGNYTISNLTFPLLTLNPSNPLHIVGAGRGQTIFNVSSLAANGRWFSVSLPSNDSTFESFSVQADFAYEDSSALSFGRGAMKNFSINVEAGGDGQGNALVLASGTKASNGAVSVSGPVNGIATEGADVAASNLQLSGADDGIGIRAVGDVGVFDHLRINGFYSGFQQVFGSSTLTDSLIKLGTWSTSTGVKLFEGSTGTTSSVGINASRLTIIGSGDNQDAILAESQESSDTVSGNFQDIVAFSASGSNFRGFACSSSLYGGSISVQNLLHNGGSFVFGYCDLSGDVSQSLTDSPFKDLAAGDYRPKAGSALVDRGVSTAGSPATDLAGSTRVVDGDGDGSASVDVGAFEYQRAAPTVSLSAGKTELALLEATTFTADASDPDDETLTYDWKLDGVSSPLHGETHSGGFITAGAHQVAVTVTDPAGLTATATVDVNVTGDDSGPGSGGGGNDGGGKFCTQQITDSVTLVGKSKKSFKRGKKKGFHVAGSNAKQPFFTIDTYVNNGSDTSGAVKITLEKITKVKRRTKYKKVAGSQVLRLDAGRAKIGFGGRWKKTALKAGSYRVKIAPSFTPAGCRTSGLAATTTIKVR